MNNKQLKKHAIAGPTGPAVCGAGNGQKLFDRLAGTLVDDLATLDIEQHITCKRCLRRVRRRFPLWFDVFGGFVRR